MSIGSDKGLKQALVQEEPAKLSSNYYFRTMEKVEEMARRQERKAGWRISVLLLCVSLALVGGGIIILLHYCPGILKVNLMQAVKEGSNMPVLPLWALAVLVLLLLVFDYWIRKAYAKRFFGKS